MSTAFDRAALRDQFQCVISGDGNRTGRNAQGYRQVLADLVFPQAENGEPWQHGPGLPAQSTRPSPAPFADRSDTLAEHGRRLAEALGEAQQA